MVNLKSMREIGLMRRAGIAVWEAHQIAARMVRPGATTAAIDRAIAEHFERLGAQPLFKNYPNTVRNKPPFPRGNDGAWSRRPFSVLRQR